MLLRNQCMSVICYNPPQKPDQADQNPDHSDHLDLGLAGKQNKSYKGQPKKLNLFSLSKCRLKGYLSKSV